MSDGSEISYESDQNTENVEIKDYFIKTEGNTAETATIIKIEEDENSIKISDTIKVENDPTNTIEVLKPFRSAIYYNFDELYARHLKLKYVYVEVDIKEKFNKHTEQLLDERYICRNKLLDAIDTFKYKSIIIKDIKDDYAGWVRFTDEAFNYRPHQPCIIS